jgi:class 3 adenylate cyclase
VVFRAKRLDQPDEVILFERGRAELLQLGALTVGRVVHEPGWSWSKHVKPLVGTEWCETQHLGLVLSGRLHVRLEDGSEHDYGQGEVVEIPPGHDAWVVGDEEVVEFDFGGLRNWLPSNLDAGERVLLTILFTDIVDSTLELDRVGDRAWRGRLADHGDAVRRALDEYRGRLIKTTGDGILATFDGPARAVRAAVAIRSGLAALSLGVRAAGEVELVDGDLQGVAVHEAARLLGLAGAGDVLVSATTHDLLAGSGIPLVERGSHRLRGLPGRRVVYAFGGEEAKAPG